YLYDPAGELASVTNPLLQTESYTYDAAGRLVAVTRADGNAVLYGYDQRGNPTSVTPPGRPAHQLTFGPTNLLEQYIAPDAGQGPALTQFRYDADRRPVTVTRPDGSPVALGYDAAGRPNSVVLPTGTIALGYDPATGRLATATGPSGASLSFEHDGRLLTRTAWSGAIAGSVERSYDAFFRLASERVNAGDPVSLHYDDDGLLTGVGILALSHQQSTGLLAGASIGNVAATLARDAYGALSSFSASFGATPLLSTSYERDGLGRIVRRAEAIQGQARVTEYAYDSVGRLVSVRTDGSLSAEYQYDENGNRVLAHTPSGTPQGVYDAQDRLLEYGSWAFSYTPNGELRTKTNTATGEAITYSYDALGNLLAVTLPHGRLIEYLVDAAGRRVGKKVDGVLRQGLLYRDDLRPVAQLDASGNVVTHLVWADGSAPDEAVLRSIRARLGIGPPAPRAGRQLDAVPLYLVKDTHVFAVLTDHLGSPRLVVDVATGEVAQRLDYDEFGNVTLDTNPGFQPLGFAGGLYDTDTGLLPFGARDYDPHVGRWTTTDPLVVTPFGTNGYAYASGDPVDNSDPLGCDMCAECMAKCYAPFAIVCIVACQVVPTEDLMVACLAVCGAPFYYFCLFSYCWPECKLPCNPECP
ncbi:MAG: hypothetical protein HY744_09540, partial [Deltaproteobacteria bacterium]|nr:hypothetical protein [Deltaproteobacteria bacterium]